MMKKNQETRHKTFDVDVDLCSESYGVMCTYDNVGTFDTLTEAKSFAEQYAKIKKNFRRSWLKQYEADEIVLTIRENKAFDEDGCPCDWEDIDCVDVVL